MKNIEFHYAYHRDGRFFVGYLDEYPEYPTQGLSLNELEENLLDIYNMTKNGTLHISALPGMAQDCKLLQPLSGHKSQLSARFRFDEFRLKSNGESLT
jgi:hypothetical protein